MKGNHQPNESITFGMGENIHKCYQQGFNFQNIHTDHTTQYQKKKNNNQKMDRRPHGLQPTRPLPPWDFPGKSTGVGCHCLLHKEDIQMDNWHVK